MGERRDENSLINVDRSDRELVAHFGVQLQQIATRRAELDANRVSPVARPAALAPAARRVLSTCRA